MLGAENQNRPQPSTRRGKGHVVMFDPAVLALADSRALILGFNALMHWNDLNAGNKYLVEGHHEPSDSEKPVVVADGRNVPESIAPLVFVVLAAVISSFYSGPLYDMLLRMHGRLAATG